MTLLNTTLKIPFVDLAAQHQTIKWEVEQAISRVLQNTDFILGQDVTLLEQEFALFCEANYAVGVDSGTSALELALKAYDIGPGDEVITAANTFIATVLAITSVGATPVLVDIDLKTYGLDPARLEAAITRQTKAIIPVHLFGHPVDMDPILDIAMRQGLIVIEDASQAHGARYQGQRVGSLGYAAAFSFYPAKNLGAYGDGGMLVTNDPQIAETVRMMRNYGQSQKYYHVVEGYNRRLDTLQAAVLRAKLPHMNAWNQARRQRAKLYDRMLADSAAICLTEAEYAEAVYHLYVVRVENRDALQEYLQEKGIATGIHYPTPIHLQPVYQHLGYVAGDFPITEQYAKQILSLPMYPELSLSAIEVVAQAINSFMPLRPTSPIITRSKSLG